MRRQNDSCPAVAAVTSVIRRHLFCLAVAAVGSSWSVADAQELSKREQMYQAYRRDGIGWAPFDATSKSIWNPIVTSPRRAAAGARATFPRSVLPSLLLGDEPGDVPLEDGQRHGAASYCGVAEATHIELLAQLPVRALLAGECRRQQPEGENAAQYVKAGIVRFPLRDRPSGGPRMRRACRLDPRRFPRSSHASNSTG